MRGYAVALAGLLMVVGPRCGAQLLCDGSKDVQPPHPAGVNVKRFALQHYDPVRPTLNIWIVRKDASRSAAIQLAFLDERAANRDNTNLTLVNESDLRDRISALEGSDSYPDGIVFRDGPPPWWAKAEKSLVAKPADATLQPPVARSLAPLEPDRLSNDGKIRWVVMARAPHLLAALEGVIVPHSSSEGQISNFEYIRFDHPREVDPWRPAQVAARVLSHVMAGDGVGSDADAEMLQIDSGAVRDAVFQAEADVDESKFEFETCVLHASAGDRLAVVSLRTMFAGGGKYGFLRSVMVLRTVEAGEVENRKWQVLQLSLDLSPGEALKAVQELESNRGARQTCCVTCRCEPPPPLGIASPASPPDGDSRLYIPAPELWIDPAGSTSRMLLIEWQPWADLGLTSYPYFVHDFNPKLVTRVSAPFSNVTGLVRWRVWAFGGGDMTISPWRSVTLHE